MSRPVLRIRCDHIDFSPNGHTFRCSIENISDKTAYNPMILFQMLRYNRQEVAELSSDIPLEKSAILSGEEPLAWEDPRNITGPTKSIAPREILHRDMWVNSIGDVNKIGIVVSYGSGYFTSSTEYVQVFSKIVVQRDDNFF